MEKTTTATTDSQLKNAILANDVDLVASLIENYNSADFDREDEW